MLIIELKFSSGRFHATPWGRHVNEGAPEWPPSPYRLVRTLFDTWKRKRPEWSAARVEPILAALASSAPLFQLPPANVSHTRSFLSENRPSVSERKQVFDGFVVLQPQASVLLGWPQVVLEDRMEADLNDLLSLTNFFGRSESWVIARVLTGVRAIDWNCFPIAEAPEEWEFELIKVACPVSMTAYNSNPYEVVTKNKRKGSEKIVQTWLDTLAWTTDDLVNSLRSDPPAFQRIAYARSTRCFELSPLSHQTLQATPVYAAMYALESKIMPQVTASLEIAERVRIKLMGIHKRIVGDPALVSPKFSGKQAGKPMSGHRHAYMLPLDQNGDGRLDHLLIRCHEPFSQSELLALDQLNSLWQSDGKPDIRCTPLLFGNISDVFKISATTFRSATPFVPPRHYRHGRGEFKEWLKAEVRRECEFHRLAQPISVNFVDKLTVKRGRDFRWLEFRRSRKDEVAQIGYGFELKFEQPEMPFALGYGSHFGLGLFLPVE